jgi:hypothetical protein
MEPEATRAADGGFAEVGLEDAEEVGITLQVVRGGDKKRMCLVGKWSAKESVS